MTKEHEELLEKVTLELNKDGKLEKMRAFIQHGDVSTYDHVLSVAKKSLELVETLHLEVNEEELVRGALLHDYFLYDWHTWQGPLHGTFHPLHAVKNASKDFKLTGRERNIIRSHMWPLTLFHPPLSKEAVIVCMADKMCSTKETAQGISNKILKHRHRKYAEQS